jgi:hypothetical protein
MRGAALAVCQIKIIKLDRSPTLPLQCAGGKFNQADYWRIIVDNQARRFGDRRPRARRSAKPISWTRPRTPRSIGRVRKVAPIDRKAAASDTLSQTDFETLKLSDPVVDASHPFARKARPVAASRDPIGWQLGELRADLLKGKADPLREHDKGDPAQHGSRKTAMS